MLIEDVLGKNGVIAKKSGSYELRPEQLDMALAIEKAIEDNKHLIVEAGTGVGKSMAYLLPFIFWSVINNKKVIISTHTKTLQEQLIKKDLPFLRNALKSVNVFADTRDNNCPAQHEQKDEFDFFYALCVGGQNYLCLRRFHQAQKQGVFNTKKEFIEFEQIIQWETQAKRGLRSELDFEPSPAIWSKVCRESDLCFGKKCSFKDDCYYNKARRKEYKAQILVTNHHLFFANLASDGRVLPDFDAVVFDEAHTLEDIATGYFGVEVSNSRIKYMLDSILNPKTGKGLITRLFDSSNTFDQADKTGIISDCETLLKEAGSASDLFFSEVVEKYGTGNKTTRIRKKGIINNYLDKPLSNLYDLLESLSKQVKTDEDRLEIIAFANRCSETKRNIFTIINQELEECVYWAEVIRRKSRYGSFTNTLQLTNTLEPLNHKFSRCSLLAAPINVAREFERQIFGRIRPVILTSATLSINGNFKYIKGRLGIPVCAKPGTEKSLNNSEQEEFDPCVTTEDDYNEKAIGSPFNFSENALIYIPDNIPDPNLQPDKFKDNIIKHIEEIITYSQGRTFILFTSFKMLNSVYEEIWEELDEFTIFRQGDKPRYQLIEEFKTSEKAVLFGTATFWQGVDVPGEALKCVIITKLPFAVPDDPIIEARMELLKSQNKNPFMFYQVPQAITLLRQGFGRLIRSTTDTGVVAILDPRIKSKFYGKYFLNSLPDCKKVSEIEEIKNFFNPFEC
ncbi:ATP-dependent helicase [Candidatus Scalindua japonica]|uniref:DNA 5'-3' helicase n=1 Tax=Candidatus Scalindua japonica TaxID=1284222 RepID=A0A286U209_9BACT|nr:helicase C-terminal domain-containing protein [Candidatus Scalindua japonica]GAX62178.1 ATP-dependent helicase [Candidatus Scalindua japonica]